MPAFTCGIDVGGTFTDLIAVDAVRGDVRFAKVPTTVENQAHGVLNAINAAGLALEDIALIIHGTTATTNAVLERKLAKVGLITTRGFRDSLELGRRTRPTPYGLKGTFDPLVPRERRLEVPERMLADGSVQTPLDEAAFAQAVNALQSQDCESLVIHFLHSYLNPAHELRAEAIAKSLWHNEYISVGHKLVAEFREYERGVTAAVNASVQPILGRYIDTLRTLLRDGAGRPIKLLIMQGNGGTVAAEDVAKTAVQTVMSGPASGVIAAIATGCAEGTFGRAEGESAARVNLITYDMGGTSTDVALINEGAAAVSSELELEYAMPLRVPLVDVHTVGAGGGSIAFVNEAGLLHVGPRSAGAKPGPICYGRGGSEPTITDANVLLGRLDLQKLLSVGQKVPSAQIAQIFETKIGARLGLNAVQSAHAIVRIANDTMAGAIRMVSIARGHDPRDFALFPFGGAGPLHACALARELNIPRLLIPARPGITNALGCALADLRQDVVKTLNAPLPALDIGSLHALFATQYATGATMVESSGIAIERIEARYALDMQFAGQSHVLRVPIADPQLSKEALATLFAQAYWHRFRVRLPEMRPVVVNVHTAVIGERTRWNLALLAPEVPSAQMATAQIGQREVWFDSEQVSTPIFDRLRLPRARIVEGPAIIEQMDCTFVLDPGWTAQVDPLGNLVCADTKPIQPNA